MEVAVVAEAEEVEFQALALHHQRARDVINNKVAKIRLTRLGAQRRELGAIERYHIFVLGVLVLEGLQHIGAIVKLILRALVAQQRHTF